MSRYTQATPSESHDVILQALQELASGTSVKFVANMLHGMGIKGRRCSRLGGPVTAYLWLRTKRTVEVAEGMALEVGRDWWEAVIMPPGVARFQRDFDGGCYPELEVTL